MGMDGLVPTFSVNDGGNNANGWGDAIGAFAGALFGSWWGNGWGGGFGNNGGNGGCCNSGGGAPSVIIAGNPGGGTASTAELDALSGIQTSINGVGLQVLQGQNAANLAACQGFGGLAAETAAQTASVNNTLTQGFAGLNSTIVSGDQALQNSLCQGFNGVNTAILSSSKDNALLSCQSTNQITSAINDCCCTTQRTIMAEGSATRQLIDRYAYENLQTQLCDAKSKIASMEAQNFTAQAVAGLGSQLRNEMNANTVNIIGHMAAIRSAAASTTTPAA